MATPDRQPTEQGQGLNLQPHGSWSDSLTTAPQWELLLCISYLLIELLFDLEQFGTWLRVSNSQPLLHLWVASERKADMSSGTWGIILSTELTQVCGSKICPSTFLLPIA